MIRLTEMLTYSNLIEGRILPTTVHNLHDKEDKSHTHLLLKQRSYQDKRALGLGWGLEGGGAWRAVGI